MNLTQKVFKQDIDALLNEIGVKDLPESEKAEVIAKMLEHFDKLILETVVENLSDEQIGEFNQALDLASPGMEQEIIAITARVPGLAQKIEAAVRQEIIVLKSAKSQLDAK